MHNSARCPDTSSLGIPALLRAVRNTYAAAIREALIDIDCEDVPRDGVFVISVVSRFGAPMREIVKGLAVSKTAASQLIDTLVLRGYLQRVPNPSDARRMTLKATERGHAAAAAARTAMNRLEDELTARVGKECVAQTRTALSVLAMIGEALVQG